MTNQYYCYPFFAHDYSQDFEARISLSYHNLCGIDTLTFTSLASIWLCIVSHNNSSHNNNLSTKTSWHVLLMIYNISLWLCMKRKYMLLSMMISGPRQPGNYINVYLIQFIKDLRVLWEEFIDVDDAYSGKKFKKCAMLIFTINDFLAYGNLSRYNVKGYKVRTICTSNTCSYQLHYGKRLFTLGIPNF